MSVSINRVVIGGHLCFDPELTTLASGRVVTNLRVAVDDRERDAAGVWQDRPSFVDVAVWGAQAESCCAHLAKGSGVAVDGHLRQEQWQAKDGTPRSALKIVAERVQFLSAPASVAAEKPQPAAAPSAQAAQAAQPAPTAGFADNDIPF